ncbi:hypothetical protein PENSPDRAFT_683358 [Peniophora sp. CONT]|nr:hypothetical protein PENSPDRAFT_683358 [Peniophora sp. CONT]
MSDPFDADVLVIGAGPVGLVGALTLAMNGVKVRVIEKLPALAVGQRGAGVVPRTLETYSMLGFADEVKAAGAKTMQLQRYDTEGRPTEVTDFVDHGKKAPGTPYPEFWLLGQDGVCRIVARRLKEQFGIDIEFGTELVDLDQDDIGVTAAVKAQGTDKTIRVKYVVAADGGKGTSRRLAGAELINQSNTEGRMLVGDLALKGFSNKYWHQFQDENGNVLLVRPVPEDPELFWFIGYGPDLDIARATTDVGHLLGWMHKVTHNPDIAIDKVSTLADWRLNVRMCEKFQSGRIILAGDAAHLHSPTGAQGLTSGVMDVRNLSWKLALVCKGLALPDLLETYSEERVPVISEMLKVTTKIASATFKAKPDDDAFKRPTHLGQLGVHYRWSSIVHDGLRVGEAQFESTNLAPPSTYGLGEKMPRLQAGDRAPDAPGLIGPAGETTLFDNFSVARHTVLVFGPSHDAAVRAAVARYPKGFTDILTLLPEGSEKKEGALIDAQGHAYRGYAVEAGVAVAIVRPDGVVGALLKEDEGVEVYFSRIFSA